MKDEIRIQQEHVERIERIICSSCNNAAEDSASVCWQQKIPENERLRDHWWL